MATKTKKTELRSKPSAAEIGGKVPPHSNEMERALLCSALIDPNGMARVADVVDSDDFYDRRHRLVFSAMESLFNSGKPIDILTVSDELERTGELESSGGDAYLANLSNELATSTHAEHYARVVKDRSSMRRLISKGTSIVQDAYEAPDAQELLDTAMQHLFEIYNDRQNTRGEHIEKPLGRVHTYLDKIHSRKGEKLTGIGTGFEKLDEMTSGFQNGDFIVIAGRPSMGKTAFSLDLARNACMIYQVPVAFFSLEMASTAIALRLLAAEAHLDLHKLRSANLKESEWEQLSRTTGILSEIPFYIDDTGTLGITDLRARARVMKQQYNIGIVFIDYLQLMKPPKADSREQEVAQISRSLKGLARELEIPVVAMSQLSRAVEQRGGDHRPQLSDLRDSGAIEQDADVVMFIYRPALYKSDEGDNGKSPEPEDNTTEVILRKQRNGPTGTVKLVFKKEWAHFERREDSRVLAETEIPADIGDEDKPPF